MPGEVVSTLTVASWNVLAAPWAAPAFYPAGMDPALLDRDVRADLVADRILAIDADVWCLQEVTPTDLSRMLGRGVGGGTVWLFTPKTGRPGTVPHTEIEEAATTAGLHATSTVAVGAEWSGTRLGTRKGR